MKKVKIIYNPFLLTTTITVDGKKPDENSSLDFNKQRLQEWAEKLPKILLDEYRDRNIAIEFTGTLDDFTDLKEILKTQEDVITVSEYTHHRTPDVEEVEKEVLEIYDEITNGPVAALKDDSIREAFDEASRSEFSINVVATMSSGKSSLINALLGTYLMPVANMATTATIVRIIASDQKLYSGIAFDSAGEEIYREKDLTLAIMKKWNLDERISTIDIYGPVPCVDSVGMRLVLIDTPGPNNSRDENHKRLTYEMLAESEKSLVLFVMNATQLNIGDEAEFLHYVCECMKEGGKQSRDRFIFAVNKLDRFNPRDGDNVPVALDSIRKGLDELDIKDPNIFPASSLAALEIRTKDDEPVAIDTFRRRCSKGDEFHFESYYGYNHLPIPSRARLEDAAREGDEDKQLLIHTGIPSIEEAIRLYVNKYARTIKVRDLVDAFNRRLTELKAEDEIMERIQHDKEEKARLDAEISKIQKEIESGRSAKEYGKLIDAIDIRDDVRDEMGALVGGLNKRIDDIVRKYNSETKMSKEKALLVVKTIQDEKKDIQDQMEARVTKVFEKTFKKTYETIMNIYRDRLKSLGFASADNVFEFNPMDFVGQEMADIDSLVKKSSWTVDEGTDEQRSRTVQGKKKTNWFWEPSTWFTKRYEQKTEYYTVHVPKNVDYVNMQSVVAEFFVPMQTDLIRLEKDVPAHLEQQAAGLKENLKQELTSIEQLLNRKLSDIKERMNVADRTAVQLAEQEKQLAWMRYITSRVNKLVNY